MTTEELKKELFETDTYIKEFYNNCPEAYRKAIDAMIIKASFDQWNVASLVSSINRYIKTINKSLNYEL